MTALQLAVFLALAAPIVGVVWFADRDWHRSAKPEPEPGKHSSLSPWAIIAALLLPIAGLIIAIVLLAQGRGSHGAAVLLTSIVGWVLAAALFL